MVRDIGSQFGPYIIQSLLGAGGMGEVYRARDPRLNRDVALKFLHPGADAQRFQREAKIVAALNHPNIVAIYDVGDDYIVTELIEGKSLRNLKRSLRESIDCAAQIAEGLAAAHTAGVTHRDLKPDNIMVTREGRAKILDFGLAQQSATAPLGASDSTKTAAGTVMGTAGYMSPEQVRAQPVDARSDIFSFGATLYELLSGKQPFASETFVQTMSAVLEKNPPMLPDTVPHGLRAIIERCLEKEPARRFQSAADLAYSLRALSGASVPPESAGRRMRSARVLKGALAASTAAAVLFAAIATMRPWQPDLAAYRFTPFATEEYPEYGPSGLPTVGPSRIARLSITNTGFW